MKCYGEIYGVRNSYMVLSAIKYRSW